MLSSEGFISGRRVCIFDNPCNNSLLLVPRHIVFAAKWPRPPAAPSSILSCFDSRLSHLSGISKLGVPAVSESTSTNVFLPCPPVCLSPQSLYRMPFIFPFFLLPAPLHCPPPPPLCQGVPHPLLSTEVRTTDGSATPSLPFLELGPLQLLHLCVVRRQHPTQISEQLMWRFIIVAR